MACDILQSIKIDNNYKSFTDRYFTKRYIIDFNGIKNNDIMIMFHSNRVALLCLAPSHFFFNNNNNNYKLNFSVGNIDRLSNTVKGKSKKGGQMLMPKSVICKIDYEDGTSFDVPSCMKSTLIEVNEQLVSDPHLLRKKPDADGFIAILLSSIAISDATKNELLSYEDYIKVIDRLTK